MHAVYCSSTDKTKMIQSSKMNVSRIQLVDVLLVGKVIDRTAYDEDQEEKTKKKKGKKRRKRRRIRIQRKIIMRKKTESKKK